MTDTDEPDPADVDWMQTAQNLEGDLSRLRRRLNQAQEQLQTEQEAYRYLADAVIKAFNPADDDWAEPDLCARAVEAAGQFIAAQPCVCAQSARPDFTLVDTCRRCQTLGRVADRVIAR